MTTRAQIVDQARTWIGTPFHHAACTKGVGVDCLGLLVGVARELGLFAADFTLPPYTQWPDGHSMLEGCDRYMMRVSQADMRPGDAILLIADVHPAHVGILGDYPHGGLSIIHAAGTFPMRVIETRLMFSRRLRFVGAYTLPGVT